VHHLLEALPSMAGELLAGLVVGAVMVGAVHLVRRIRAKVAVS
jgi:hypothetical protein